MKLPSLLFALLLMILVAFHVPSAAQAATPVLITTSTSYIMDGIPNEPEIHRAGTHNISVTYVFTNPTGSVQTANYLVDGNVTMKWINVFLQSAGISCTSAGEGTLSVSGGINKTASGTLTLQPGDSCTVVSNLRGSIAGVQDDYDRFAGGYISTPGVHIVGTNDAPDGSWHFLDQYVIFRVR